MKYLGSFQLLIKIEFVHIFCGLLIIAMTSCGESAVFERMTDLSTQEWSADSTYVFPLKDIQSASGPYEVNLLLRNAQEFRTCNIFIHYALTTATGDTLKSDLIECFLYDCTTGKPLGEGVGNFFMHRFVLAESFTPPSEEVYLSLKHGMRTEEPLPKISALGVQIFKREN